MSSKIIVRTTSVEHVKKDEAIDLLAHVVLRQILQQQKTTTAR